MPPKKLISLMSPCLNEEGNIEELYRRASAVMATLPQYGFEYLFIDNASTFSHQSRLCRGKSDS